nr:hypothetical protein [Tanacetum cinerariifolium]
NNNNNEYFDVFVQHNPQGGDGGGGGGGGGEGGGGGGGGGDGGRYNFIEDLGDLQSFLRLQEMIKRNGKQIQQVVKFCFEQYEKDSKPAVVELFTMMFKVL